MFTLDDLPAGVADWRNGDPTMVGNALILSSLFVVPSFPILPEQICAK